MLRIISSMRTTMIGIRWRSITQSKTVTFNAKKMVKTALKVHSPTDKLHTTKHVEVTYNEALTPICYEKIGDNYSTLFYTNKTFFIDALKNEKQIKEEIGFKSSYSPKDDCKRGKKLISEMDTKEPTKDEPTQFENDPEKEEQVPIELENEEMTEDKKLDKLKSDCDTFGYLVHITKSDFNKGIVAQIQLLNGSVQLQRIGFTDNNQRTRTQILENGAFDAGVFSPSDLYMDDAIKDEIVKFLQSFEVTKQYSYKLKSELKSKIAKNNKKLGNYISMLLGAKQTTEVQKALKFKSKYQ